MLKYGIGSVTNTSVFENNSSEFLLIVGLDITQAMNLGNNSIGYTFFIEDQGGFVVDSLRLQNLSIGTVTTTLENSVFMMSRRMIIPPGGSANSSNGTYGFMFIQGTLEELRGFM